MKFIEFAKIITMQDILILNLDALDFSDTEIASMLNISRQTIHNCKKRLEPFTEALKAVKSPPTEFGNKDINKIVDAFAKAFGTTTTTKYDRFAAKRLGEKHGYDNVVGAIVALSANGSDPYCPTVNDVSQFEKKLPQIIKYLRGKSDTNQGINL